MSWDASTKKMKYPDSAYKNPQSQLEIYCKLLLVLYSLFTLKEWYIKDLIYELKKGNIILL